MVKQQYPTAKVFPVPVGNLTVEGLMLEDDSYAIAVPQVADLLGIPIKNAIRDFLYYLENARLSFPQTKDAKNTQTLENTGTRTFLKVVVSSLNCPPVSVLSLDDFRVLLRVLDRKGNQRAQDFNDLLADLSLYQLFSDAVGIELTKENRQAFLKARQQGKEVRRTLTDELKDYCDTHDVSDNYKKFIYLNVSRVITEALFGRNPKKLAEDWGVPQNQLRDSMTAKELQHLESFERTIMGYLQDTGDEPHQAVKDFVKNTRMKPRYAR